MKPIKNLLYLLFIFLFFQNCTQKGEIIYQEIVSDIQKNKIYSAQLKLDSLNGINPKFSRKDTTISFLKNLLDSLNNQLNVAFYVNIIDRIANLNETFTKYCKGYINNKTKNRLAIQIDATAEGSIKCFETWQNDDNPIRLKVAKKMIETFKKIKSDTDYLITHSFRIALTKIYKDEMQLLYPFGQDRLALDSTSKKDLLAYLYLNSEEYISKYRLSDGSMNEKANMSPHELVFITIKETLLE